MLIEHTTKRPNGSVHSIGADKYHFKANADGAHVAEVENPAHIQRFLSIASFTIYSGDHAAEPTAPAAPVDPVNPDDEPAPIPMEEAPDDVLDQLYQDAYGKKPHHKFSREKIIDMIRKAPVKE